MVPRDPASMNAAMPALAVAELNPAGAHVIVNEVIAEICPQMNPGQVGVVHRYVEAIYLSQPVRMMCVGGAGTGKTTVIRVIMKSLQRLGLASYVALVAYYHRAVVALLGLGGRSGTTTSIFGLNSRGHHALLGSEAGGRADDLMRLLRGVIVDECSLVGVKQLGGIEARMRLANTSARDPSRPFGALALLLVGDYAQHRAIGDMCMYANWTSVTSASAAQARTLMQEFDDVTFLNRLCAQTTPWRAQVA